MQIDVKSLWSQLIPSRYALLITIPILIFLQRYITNQHMAYWRISVIILLLGIFFMARHRLIKPNWPLWVFCVAGCAVYTINYHILGKLNLIPIQDYDNYRRIINKYVLYLPFLLLPTVFFYSGFKPKHFFNLLLLAAMGLIFYVNVHNFQLAFDREQLADLFDPIISYDIGAMSIGVMLLCYAFYASGKWAYCLLLLACLSLFTIILHGSRGTWIGLPLIVAVLCWQYFKTARNKCVLMLALFTAFITINVIIPNSPIMNRMASLQADYHNISQYSYDNSSGIRLMLWQNSVHLFQSAPLAGVGMYGIQQQNCALHAQGSLPICFQHQHNIVFEEMAANGMLGLLGLFFTFITPASYFLRQFRQHNNALTKNLSLMGLCILTYYFCSGLTEYYLFFADVTYWFYFTLASLMSFVYLQNKASQ